MFPGSIRQEHKVSAAFNRGCESSYSEDVQIASLPMRLHRRLCCCKLMFERGKKKKEQKRIHSRPHTLAL